MRAGRREGVGAAAAQAARWEDPTAEAAGGGTRGAHPKHCLHGCDAGRVEAQRLVERCRVLPSWKGSIGRGATCGPGGGRACGGGGGASRAMTVEAAGRGTCGAHHKHVLHGCDAGRVEAEQLVERRRGLPSRKGSIGRGATCGPGGGRAWGAAAAAQAGRWEDPTVEAAGKGTRGAHPKHGLHGCDAGRVEAQRLVERRRLLPSRKGSTHKKRGKSGPGRREGVWGRRRRKQRAGRGPDCGGCWRGHARSARKTCGTWL